MFTGGYPFYHPIEMLCIRYGGLSALFGLISSLLARGKVRLHVAVISAVGLLAWFMDAMWQ
jgi:hypothetical protein